jgi:hypothetical protein
MNILTRAAMITTMAAALFVALAPSAKSQPVDFSRYQGNYVGSWIIGGTSGAFASTVFIKVQVPPNGRTMTIDIRGKIYVSTSTIPVRTTMIFLPNGRMISDSFFLGYFGPMDTQNARYTGRSGTFRFPQIPAATATLFGHAVTGSANYSVRFTRRTLDITGQGNADSGSGPTALNIRVHSYKLAQ